MPIAVKQFQSTPNPNAVKCILSASISDSIRSYRRPEDAASDPLAAALFRIPGVTGLLITPDWITVNKAAEAGWGTIQKAISQALKSGLHAPPANPGQ